MTPIDLFDYTNTSEKVPMELLHFEFQRSEKLQPFQVIPAYFIDALSIATTTIGSALVLELSMNSLLPTASLRDSFEAIDYTGFVINLMPLVVVSYYFFSFFFNQGQSYGMNHQKIRVEMPHMSYRSSLVWATFSAAALLTLGLSTITYHWLTESGFGDFKVQDHLYAKLTEPRDLSPINLLKEIDSFKEAPEEYFVRAA